MASALDKFRRVFAGWAAQYSASTAYRADPEDLLRLLSTRIPEDQQRQIGSAFLNRWLETEATPGRGYYIRETDREQPGGGQYVLTHIGGGKVAPCWELYVQLADYAQLRTIAELRSLQVRLEDHLMDITVWAGETLILYVENKVEKNEAIRLVKRMREYGEEGFNLEEIDKGNDPLKKCKYLFRKNRRPEFFAVSAVDYRQLYRVEYLGGNNRFRLTDLDDAITAPLYEARISGQTPPRGLGDAFALEIQREAAQKVWISPGTGQTAYNIYLPGDSRDGLFPGVYDNGHVWTDTAALGPVRALRLANGLQEVGVHLDASKAWSFWISDGARFGLGGEHDVAVAQAVVQSVLKNAS